MSMNYEQSLLIFYTFPLTQESQTIVLIESIIYISFQYKYKSHIVFIFSPFSCHLSFAWVSSEHVIIQLDYFLSVHMKNRLLIRIYNGRAHKGIEGLIAALII